MEGNFVQALDVGAMVAFLFGVCGWQLYSTSRAKKRRIGREKAEKAKADGGLDAGGI